MIIFIPKFIQKLIRSIVKPKYVKEIPNPQQGGGMILGQSGAFGIKIREDQRNKPEVLEHEYIHVYQKWQTLFLIHALLSVFSSKYRLWVEVSAYAISVRAGRSIDEVSLVLSQIPCGANLKLTQERAKELVQKEMQHNHYILEVNP